jgi:hypothetical protein
MSLRLASSVLLAFALLPWVHVAEADQATLDPAKVVLPPKATRRVASPMVAPPAQKAHPPRMNAATLSLLKPRLAALLNVSAASLPLQTMDAPSLAAPGSTVNVKVGQTPPAGFSWMSQNPWLLNATSFNMWPGSGPAGDYGYLNFKALQVGPGTYLVTVYVETTMTSVDCRVDAGAAGGQFYSVAVQSGMLIVPVVVGVAGSIDFFLRIPSKAGPKSGLFTCYSCDFTKIN